MNLDVATVAADVRAGRLSAVAVAREALARIHARSDLLAITRVLEARALQEAAAVDAKVARGEDPGPLAGVPYAVKDLFDVAGLATTAGAARLEFAEPAPADAEAIVRLQAAGAVLVATCNMDEFAYGFVTDNARWGITRNPHDPARFAGGSSGGSAAAVAGGLVAFALGSDTNGSIRVPASLCGVFGIRPTQGALPTAGTFPFVHTFDTIGAFTRSAQDLALVDDTLRSSPLPFRGGGGGGASPDCAGFGEGLKTINPALLGGWFTQDLTHEMVSALAMLGPLPKVEIEGVAQARSAAFLITAYEGGHLHAQTLRNDAMAYDPATRDRLLAGAALPDAIHARAMAFRDVFAARLQVLLDRHGVLIAPSVMGPAPLIADPVVQVGGKDQPARANLGLFAQPISFVGVPVVAAPLAVPGLPLGVQLIGAKGSDRALIAYAAQLEAQGLLRATPP